MHPLTNSYPHFASFSADEDESGAFQYRARASDLTNGSSEIDSMKDPVKSYSSLASANTSPVSTLTGSSDVDNCRVLQDSGIYTTGSNSIGSIMSMSVSEKSTSSMSPTVRRHSLTGKKLIETHRALKLTSNFLSQGVKKAKILPHPSRTDCYPAEDQLGSH